MSKYERFLIYPILFLALALSIWASSFRTNFHKLAIVNSKNEPVVLLTATDIEEGRIRIYHKPGIPSVVLGAHGISIFAPDEKLRTLMSYESGPDGIGFLELYGARSDNARISLYGNKQGDGTISVRSQTNSILAFISGRESGGYMDFATRQNQPLAIIGGIDIPLSESFDLRQGGGFAAYGPNGKTVSAFGVSNHGNGCLTLWDSNGNVLLSYPKGDSRQ